MNSRKNQPAAKNQPREVNQVQVTQVHVGPLPSPDDLQRYDEIQPGLAGRIVQMAENEARHRHDMDKTVMQNTFRERRLGQVLGFAIGVFTIAAGAYVAVSGAQAAGAIISGSAVVGLVSVFVLGRKLAG